MLITFIIGPESDHWQPLSLTDSLTQWRLVNLIDVTLACEDANSKLVEVVTVGGVDAEKRFDDSLVQNSTLGSVVPLAMFRMVSAEI